MLVDLDARSDQGGVAAGIRFACDDILTFVDAALARCFWVDPTRLDATVSDAARFLPGEIVTLREGTIRSECATGAERCDCLKLANASAVVVAPPGSPIVPVPVLQGPAVAAVCESAGLRVEADQSSGSGGRDFDELHWNVTAFRSASASVAAESIAAADAALAAAVERAFGREYFHVKSAELAAMYDSAVSQISVVLTLVNFLGTSAESAHVVALSMQVLPSVLCVARRRSLSFDDHSRRDFASAKKGFRDMRPFLSLDMRLFARENTHSVVGGSTRSLKRSELLSVEAQGSATPPAA